MSGRGRLYLETPPKVAGYPIDGWWAVVVPYDFDLTNIVANPSVETNTTGYNAVSSASLARTITKQRRGAYSLQVTPGAGTGSGVYYGTVATAAGQAYPWSFDFWAKGGLPYKAYWADSSGNQVGTAVQFRGRGYWDRLQVPYIETAGASRRLYIVKDGVTNVQPFYVDGLLVPNLDDDLEELRYFDGDSRGFVANQVDFFWTGTPHGSQSIMRAHTRAGGKIVPLSRHGFVLLAMLGLGLPAPNNIALPLALPGGEQYQRTTSPAREFDLVGMLEGESPQVLDEQFAALVEALDVTRQPQTQPLILQYQARNECDVPLGERVEIECSLVGGLDGEFDNHHRLDLPLRFRVHLPVVGTLAGTQAATLDVQDTIADADYVVYRNRNGIWQDMVSGLNGAVYVSLFLPDGRILLGGDFTNSVGLAGDYLVLYDPATDTFAVPATQTLNGTVNALLQLPDGRILVGGAMTDIADANGDYLVMLSAPGGTYSSLNATPLNGEVRALVQMPDGNVGVGGDFTNGGGDANADFICKLTLATGAYSAFTAAPDFNGSVFALEIDGAYDLIVGGNFTNAGGIASADYLARLGGSTYDVVFPARDFASNALSSTVYAIKRLSNGMTAVGGAFVNVDGDATWDHLLLLSGFQFQKLVDAIDGDVYAIGEAAPGTYFIAGGMSSAGGLALFDQLVQIVGNTVVPIDLNLNGAPAKSWVAANPNTGEVVHGFNNSGNGFTSGTTTILNSGSARAYPVIVISHPTTATATAPLFAIRNLTTHQVISFHLTLLIGETITFDFQHKTMVSSVRGNLKNLVLPGSHFDTFFLAPGTNVINIFSTVASGSLPDARIWWTPAYKALADATY